MDEKTIIYDKVFEVVEVYDIKNLKKYLSDCKQIDRTTCLTWDVIACFTMDTMGNGDDNIVYILGKKYKRIDHINN